MVFHTHFSKPKPKPKIQNPSMDRDYFSKMLKIEKEMDPEKESWQFAQLPLDPCREKASLGTRGGGR